MADGRPRLSVIMAVHNGAATLEPALESLRQQSWTDFEMVIVDDASTDDSRAILERLALEDRRIQVLDQASNHGLAASLNSAWRVARGELVARMDADDVSFPTRFEKQVEFLTAHPEVAVLGTAAELAAADGGTFGVHRRPEWHEVLLRRIYRENPFIHPSVMMRRSFLEALDGYDATLRRAQDYDLWLRGARRFRFHNLQEPLIRYRVRRSFSWRASAYGAAMLVRAGNRDGRTLTGLVAAARFLTAVAFVKTGVYRTGIRSGD